VTAVTALAADAVAELALLVALALDTLAELNAFVAEVDAESAGDSHAAPL